MLQNILLLISSPYYLKNVKNHCWLVGCWKTGTGQMWPPGYSLPPVALNQYLPLNLVYSLFLSVSFFVCSTLFVSNLVCFLPCLFLLLQLNWYSNMTISRKQWTLSFTARCEWVNVKALAPSLGRQWRLRIFQRKQEDKTRFNLTKLCLSATYNTEFTLVAAQEKLISHWKKEWVYFSHENRSSRVS